MKNINYKSLLKAGVILDPKDERDFVFTTPYVPDNLVLGSDGSIPAKVDHSDKMGSVKYQGDLGSCVAFSVCALKEWQELIEHEKEVKAGKKDHRKGEEYNLSEQWVYWNCKKIDPWKNSEGTNFRSAMKVLNKIGVPTEEAWPYSDSKIDIGSPKNWASMIAKWSLIGSYWRIYGLDDIKLALIESPIVIGFRCFREIYGKLNHGVIPYPSNPQEEIGLHAVCAVGYDEEKQLIKFKNSWSVFFGEAGYGYLPYDYVKDFVLDAWIARDISVTNEMLKGTKSLLNLEPPSIINLNDNSLIVENTEKNFSLIGFKYNNSLNNVSIITDIFGIPEEEIFKLLKNIQFELFDSEDIEFIDLFCKKYFSIFRKESIKKYGFEIDVLRKNDGSIIIGICLLEKEFNEKLDENTINIQDVIEKVSKLRDLFSPDEKINIYSGCRKY